MAQQQSKTVTRNYIQSIYLTTHTYCVCQRTYDIECGLTFDYDNEERAKIYLEFPNVKNVIENRNEFCLL